MDFQNFLQSSVFSLLTVGGGVASTNPESLDDRMEILRPEVADVVVKFGDFYACKASDRYKASCNDMHLVTGMCYEIVRLSRNIPDPARKALFKCGLKIAINAHDQFLRSADGLLATIEKRTPVLAGDEVAVLEHTKLEVSAEKRHTGDFKRRLELLLLETD
ncbi:MAG: hypothetical protein LBQ43_03770 [Holosporales bacterium]|jgi:hypothetical protein|nr:hypothetical protein [Holosporales bacterium]